jgi:hypothetical protein
MLCTARDEATPLLGRLEEQGLLTSLLDDVATQGQALVLRGEAGVGKSRLRAECERTTRERGRRGHTRQPRARSIAGSMASASARASGCSASGGRPHRLMLSCCPPARSWSVAGRSPSACQSRRAVGGRADVLSEEVEGLRLLSVMSGRDPGQEPPVAAHRPAC